MLGCAAIESKAGTPVMASRDVQALGRDARTGVELEKGKLSPISDENEAANF